MEETATNSSVLKGGEFIIKESKAADVFIPEEFNEEQLMVQQMAKDFVDSEVKAHIHKLEKQENNIAATMLEKAGELGLLGSHIPEKYEGMSLDTNTNTLISEEMGKGYSFSVSFAAHTGIGMLPILYYGTEEQKQKYLPDLAAGKLKACYCLTEPSSGSDALAAKTKAVLNDAGTHYILNGQKMWISNSGFADIFIVFAKIDGNLFTGFIVERNTEGMTLGAEEDKMGIKGSSTRQVFFENAPVPVENVLGTIGKGHHIAFNVLNVGRFKLGALSLGACKDSIDLAVNYASERQQFKQPIANFGAIQYKLAEQSIRSYALESSQYRVSNLLQDRINSLKTEGKGIEESKLNAAEEYAIECAILKVYGSEVLDYVVDETVQIFGGLGFSEEFGAARAYRDARINRIYEGTNEINRLLSVDMLLKRAMKGSLDLTGPAWAVQKELLSVPTTPKPEGEFGEHKFVLQNLKKVLLIVAGGAVKYQMDGKMNLKEEQEILMNIADILIDIFNLESVLLRVEKRKGMKKDCSVQKNILDVLLHDVADRIRKNATDALISFAESDELRMMLMGVKRYTKHTPCNIKESRRAIAQKLIEENSYCF